MGDEGLGFSIGINILKNKLGEYDEKRLEKTGAKPFEEWMKTKAS